MRAIVTPHPTPWTMGTVTAGLARFYHEIPVKRASAERIGFTPGHQARHPRPVMLGEGQRPSLPGLFRFRAHPQFSP
jgi:hypothetical protein